MKTLADFKRAMQIGTVWTRKHVNAVDYVKRTVTRKCSDHVWVQDEDGKECRLDFPDASEFSVNDKGEAEIYYPYIDELYPRRLVLTYKQIQ